MKEHFDIPSSIIYLNTPGNGLLPKQTQQWRAEREKDFYDPSGFLRDQQPALIDRVRAQIATSFATELENVFCTPNFSFGFSTLIDRMPRNLHYLLLEEDYPSLNYPIISRGIRHTFTAITEDLENTILDAIKRHSPDVLLLSVVQYINGIKINLDFIKQLKKSNPDLVIIGDGTQLLGTEPINFKESGFDALGASGYKWLLSGFGNGFMMLSPKIKDMISKATGTPPSPKEAMWSNKSLLQTFFEPGHQDTLAHGTLGQSLGFLQNIGFDNIQHYLQSILDFTYEELQNRDLLLPIIKRRKTRSALINIQIAPERYQELLNMGVRCFPRGTGIRIGIHIYNTLEDIQQLLSIIDRKNKIL